MRNSTLFCGICERPAAIHVGPVKADLADPFSIEFCDRRLNDDNTWPTRTDYEFGDYYVTDGSVHYVEPFVGVEQTAAEILMDSEASNALAEVDLALYLSEESDKMVAENYRDLGDYQYTTPPPVDYLNSLSYYERQEFQWARPVSANVTVENDSNFIAVQYYDDLLTQNYQNRLLNAYVDKRSGEKRIGSVALRIVNGERVAHCVKCNAQILIDNFASSRSEQEDLVLAIIRHGNNHAANWFTTRDTFYTVNDFVKSVTAHVASEDLTIGEALNFLYDHKRYCANADCTHDEYIDVLLSESIAAA